MTTQNDTTAASANASTKDSTTDQASQAHEPAWAASLVGALDAFNLAASEQAIAKRKDTTWLTLKRLFFAVVVLTVILGYVVFYTRAFGFQADPISRSVAVIPIRGVIAPGAEASAENIVPIIERACRATHVDSLLLHISSGGGSPSESERVIAAIRACRQGRVVDGEQREGKKVVALIDGVGASAAYMIAMHSDEVYAGRYTLVGSIGALIRFNDASELANRFGLHERTYRSAPLKGGPSMIAGTTPEDDAVANELVTTMGRTFLNEVVAARGDALKADPELLFTGRVWTADEALEMGLIDGIEVLETLKATRFEGLDLHEYTTTPSLAESIGFRALVTQVITDLETPQVR
jgi:protease-4